MWIKVGFLTSSSPLYLIGSQGGDAVWGNTTYAPDDTNEFDFSHGELIAFRKNVLEASGNEDLFSMTANDASSWILEHTPSHFQVSSW